MIKSEDQNQIGNQIFENKYNKNQSFSFSENIQHANGKENGQFKNKNTIKNMGEMKNKEESLYNFKLGSFNSLNFENLEMM